MLIFQVDPNGVQGKKFKQALDNISDLRIPLELIRESWFKGNRSIFAISGKGKWADLSERYKVEKQKNKGFIYPILLRDGTLKAALTEPGHPQSVSQLEGKKAIRLGVNPNNIIFNALHYGTKFMPARPFIILGAEQTSPPELNRRTEAWRQLIADFVIQKTGAL